MISYRLKFILNKSSVKESKRETANDWVEMAYINSKLNERFALIAGKFNSEIGGWEGNTSRIDLYQASQGFSQINGLRYHTGAKIVFNIDDDNALSLQVANQEADSTVTASSTTKIDQNRSVYGVVYKGQVFDKSLQPLLSYFISPLSTGNNGNAGSAGSNLPTTTYTGKNTYSNVGVPYNKDSWVIEMDYGLINKKETSSSTTDEDWSNAVIKLAYKVENVTPALKWFNTEQISKSLGSADSKQNGMELKFLLITKPILKQNLRYHLAYNLENKKPSSGETQTTTQLYAGLSLYADILK